MDRSLRRKCIQVYAALLYNAHLKGFLTGGIYTGSAKLLCAPGLNCYSCPAASVSCPLGALQNALAASGKKAPYYMLGILLLTGLLLGRTVCGFLCPFGLIQELLHKIPTPKLRKSRVTRLLSYLKYVLLAVFVIAIPLLLAAPGFCKYICPAGTLEGALGLMAHPANGELRALAGGLFGWKLAVLIAIAVAAVFVYRVFCRFMCPLGALYGLFARLLPTGVRVDANVCTNCGKCVRECRVDIRHVGDAECVHCGECIDCCPENAISYRGASLFTPDTPKTKRNRAAAIVLACAVLVGTLVYVDLPEHAPDVGAVMPNEAGAWLTEHAGETVVLNFWATWCDPCLRELPDLERLAHEKGVPVLAVHANVVTADVDECWNALGLKLPFCVDADGTLLGRYADAIVLPRTVVLGPEGEVLANHAGAMTYEEICALLEDAGE